MKSPSQPEENPIALPAKPWPSAEELAPAARATLLRVAIELARHRMRLPLPESPAGESEES